MVWMAGNVSRLTSAWQPTQLAYIRDAVPRRRIGVQGVSFAMLCPRLNRIIATAHVLKWPACQEAVQQGKAQIKSSGIHENLLVLYYLRWAMVN